MKGETCCALLFIVQLSFIFVKFSKTLLTKMVDFPKKNIFFHPLFVLLFLSNILYTNA